jgi:hypothetical protein
MKFIFYSFAFLFITTSLYAERYLPKERKRIAFANQDNEPLPYLLVPYRVKNIWGFSDVKGNIKIAPQYNDFKEIKYYWTDGSKFQSVMIVRKGGDTFAINHHNQIIVPPNGHFDDLASGRRYHHPGRRKDFTAASLQPCGPLIGKLHAK